MIYEEQRRRWSERKKKKEETTKPNEDVNTKYVSSRAEGTKLM